VSLEEKIKALELQAKKLGQPLTFISIALDDPTAKNEQEIERLFRENIRGSDIITHLGHNNFLLLLPVDEDHALCGMQRLRALFSETTSGLFFSFGICQWDEQVFIEEAIRMSEDELSKARNDPRTMERASKAEEALKPRRAADTEDLSWRRHLKPKQ